MTGKTTTCSEMHEYATSQGWTVDNVTMLHLLTGQAYGDCFQQMIHTSFRDLLLTPTDAAAADH